MNTNTMKQENMISGLEYVDIVLKGLEGVDLVLDGMGADKTYNNFQITYYKELKSMFTESLLGLL